MAFIEVDNVSKSYKLYKRQRDLLGGIKSLVHRECTVNHAVKHVCFRVESGESVGYIGMNGAGKSTTIKMLSGILTPSEGQISVGGIVPYKKRKENARQMGVVFGQRSRLNWDLPMSDTFELYRRMYDIEKGQYERNVRFYTELLGMEEFIDHPVRQLSLGEKMRANLAAALLHSPSVVYLDEPTIGLDVIAKKRIRELIREINKENGITIMLTTHDMPDIEQICDRIIFIHKGEIFFDGSIGQFRDAYGTGYQIVVTSPDELCLDHPELRLISRAEHQYVLAGDKKRLPTEAAFAFLVNLDAAISSVQIEEASIEGIVTAIMSENMEEPAHLQ